MLCMRKTTHVYCFRQRICSVLPLGDVQNYTDMVAVTRNEVGPLNARMQEEYL